MPGAARDAPRRRAGERRGPGAGRRVDRRAGRGRVAARRVPGAAARASTGSRRLYETLEVPLVPILADMERLGIRADPERLGQLAKELDTQLDALLREIHQLAGEAVNPNSPKQLAVVLFEKLKLPPVKRTKTGYSTDVDVLEELALGHALAGEDPGVPPARQAQGHVRGRAAGAHPPADGPHPHLVQPAGRGDGAALVVESESPEHPHPHRARPAHPPGVHPRGRLALRGGRLLADRAADPRALLGGAGAGRGVPAGRGHPHAHRRADHGRRRPRRSRRRCGAWPRWSTSGSSTASRGSGSPRRCRSAGPRPSGSSTTTSRAHPRVRAYIDRVVAEGRAQGYVTTLLGRRRYLPELDARNPVAAERRRADGGQRADPGHGVRHHQARDGAPRGGARRAGPPEPDAAPGPRRAPPRGAGGRGGGRAGAPARGHGGRRDRWPSRSGSTSRRAATGPRSRGAEDSAFPDSSRRPT